MRFNSVEVACRGCGERLVIQPSRLADGRGRYCSRQCAGRHKKLTHGQFKTGAYYSWAGMKDRCRNPKSPSYAVYGGAGITYAPEWERFEVFQSDMGARPDGHTLDRIDNDKGYSKSNCRWATHKTQQRNRGVNPRFQFQGEERTAAEIAEITGINKTTVSYRLRSGWSETDVARRPTARSRKSLKA